MSDTTRSKADFKCLRERVGLSQQDVASALGVNIRSVKRWEDPSFPNHAPEDAWAVLDDAMDMQRQQVSYACAGRAERVENGAVESFGMEPVTVPITYYKDQAMYDEYGRDPGPFGQANANARAVATALEQRGINVTFNYPLYGAIRTDGSRY